MFNYSTVGLFVGSPSPGSSIFESIFSVPLQGIQSSTITLNYTRQNEFDWAGAGDQVLVNPPRVDLDFSYIYASGFNEPNLGFVGLQNTSALIGLNTERNYYMMIDLANQDLVGYNGPNSVVMSLGNGLMTRYDLRASVGQPTVVNVAIQGLNLLIQPSGGSGQILPSLQKQLGIPFTGLYTLPPFTQEISNAFESAPQNIVLSFDTGSAFGAVLSGQNFCPLQNFSFSIDLPREDTRVMGWQYPLARPIKWPVSINVKADAYLNGIQIDTLNKYGCPDSGWNFSVGFMGACGYKDSFNFTFQDAKLETEVFTAQVGSYNKVSFNWSADIYDINRISGANFFITGPSQCYNSGVFPEVNYGTGAGQTPLVLTFGSGVCAFLGVISGPSIVSGNTIWVSDEPGISIIRVSQSGTSDFQDITLIVSAEPPQCFYSGIFPCFWGTGANQMPLVMTWGSGICASMSIAAGAAIISGDYVLLSGTSSGTPIDGTTVVRVTNSGQWTEDILVTVSEPTTCYYSGIFPVQFGTGASQLPLIFAFSGNSCASMYSVMGGLTLSGNNILIPGTAGNNILRFWNSGYLTTDVVITVG